MIKWLCTFIFLSCTQLSATPSIHHITFDPGGELFQRYMGWREVRKSGQKVILDGLCLSGCVMFTSLIPPERVCITPLAIVGIHSAWSLGKDGQPVFNREGTRLYWQMLSEPIREAARKQGWNGLTEQAEFLYITYSDLLNIYHECTTEELASVYPQTE